MKPCKLTIITNTDGEETSVTYNGEMKISAASTVIRYREPNALVSLRVYGEHAEVERQGDYTLKLPLLRGALTKGEIGIGGTSGEIQTFTHKIAYSQTEQSILLSLQYDLLLGEEPQKMHLRILGRYTAEKDV